MKVRMRECEGMRGGREEGEMWCERDQQERVGEGGRGERGDEFVREGGTHGSMGE